MIGDGPPTHGRLLVFGTGPGDDPDGVGSPDVLIGSPDALAEAPDALAEAPDALAAADAVFAGPPGAVPDADPETTALFYTEAWRVERLDARDAAARLAAWSDGWPGGVAALLVAGPVEDAVAFGAALDGLARLRPGLRIDRRHGAGVTPPRRSPLTR